ncbi:MAG: hypothetical protein JWP36_973 [Paucimonas sp.]|nr:hypothetical protein [Paucimonas sp.]
MKLPFSSLAALVPLLIAAQPVAAQSSPPGAAVAANAQTLRDWIALDPQRFDALVQNNFPAVQRVLGGFYPPGLEPTPATQSHGFAGPQRSCIEDQAPRACRIYMADLLRLNQAGALPGNAAANPFARR